MGQKPILVIIRPIVVGILLTGAAFSGPLAGQTIARSSGILTIGGAPHPYLTEGTGPTCIVVGPAHMYPPLLSNRLKQRIRFVYVDFKNSWDAISPDGFEKITLDSLVEEVDQVRSGLGLEKACLFGHSAPGLVAVEYALRHPDRVSQLILVSVEPYFTPAWLKAREAFWETEASAERKTALKQNQERFPDDLLPRLSPQDAFALRYVRNGPKYFYNPSYDSYWAFAGKHFSAELINYFIKTIIANYDPRPRLTKNTVPTFLALGRYDYNIPYREWDSATKTTPHLTSHVFERSGHFPMIEEQDQFDSGLLDWLARSASSQPDRKPASGSEQARQQ
jgi:proline iminopeptidase